MHAAAPPDLMSPHLPAPLSLLAMSSSNETCGRFCLASLSATSNAPTCQCRGAFTAYDSGCDPGAQLLHWAPTSMFCSVFVRCRWAVCCQSSCFSLDSAGCAMCCVGSKRGGRDGTARPPKAYKCKLATTCPVRFLLPMNSSMNSCSKRSFQSKCCRYGSLFGRGTA